MENSYYGKFHSSLELETIFAQVFGGRLGFCGFENISPRKWVRETGCGFKYLFQLIPQYHGYSYLPCGAISLDFAPRIVAGRLKLQSKSKNAVVHYSFEKGPHRDWAIEKHREDFRERVEKISGESVTEITAWFHQFKSLADVVVALDKEKAKSRPISFYCFPEMAMAYAFALARVCRISDARSEFEEAIKSDYWDVNLHPELRQLFEAAIR